LPEVGILAYKNLPATYVEMPEVSSAKTINNLSSSLVARRLYLMLLIVNN
jgi:hypothetical protein